MLTDEPVVTNTTNQPPVQQVNNINGSNGFSINGDVTNLGTTQVVGSTQTQVTTNIVKPVSVDHSGTKTNTTISKVNLLIGGKK
jgi:hypothetical protein